MEKPHNPPRPVRLSCTHIAYVSDGEDRPLEIGDRVRCWKCDKDQPVMHIIHQE